MVDAPFQYVVAPTAPTLGPSNVCAFRGDFIVHSGGVAEGLVRETWK